MEKWLSVVGIGEDGLAGLSALARSHLQCAMVVVGGKRHLSMVSRDEVKEKLQWSSPIENTIQEIISRKGESVCVLASGDPMCFGIAVTLLRYIPLEEMTIIPTPSAFSLACAKLGWALTEVETISLCGRDPALLNYYLYPQGRLLILSEGKQTPTLVAKMLVQRGYGDSEITVLEHMGGDKERIITGIASSWDVSDIAELNVIALTCIASPHSLPLSRLAGLSDSAYHHDGQLTKKEVRSVTLAALSPLPGQLLWDVGAGCGSISIEWLRSHPRCRAIAIEKNSKRLQYLRDNAAALGVPHLKIISGEAPTALTDLPQPDAIFIGGGVSVPQMLETCWESLPRGGRLVANTVTVEGEYKLLQWQKELGGELIRIGIQRAEPVGTFLGWKAMCPITQWLGIKS